MLQAIFMKLSLIFNLILIFSLAAFGQENSKTQAKVLGVTISLPYINSYRYYDYGKNNERIKSGFGGIGLACFYKTGKNKISLNYGVTADLPAPLGPIDFGHEGTRSQISAGFIDIIYHHNLLKGLNVVAGFNVVKYKYKFISYVDTIPWYNRHDNTPGLSIGAEYIFKKSFSIAAFYRPAIISFDTKQYLHLLSLDFRFDVNIWRR